MPRGVDRRGDPNNDLTREGFFRRLVGGVRETVGEMREINAERKFHIERGAGMIARGEGPVPPPRPTGNRTQPPRSLAAEYAVKPNLYGTVSERLNASPSIVSPRVEHARETNARVSDQVSRGGHLGADPQDRSLSSWRSTDRGYRKP